MKDGDFTRSVSMQCSTCGGTKFEHETKMGPFRCVGCDRTFTREELLRENGRLIDNEVDEMAADIGKHIRDALQKSLRKALSGSKYFKLK